MNVLNRILYLAGISLSVAAVGNSLAFADGPKRKNPTSKFYVADVEGVAQINTGERIEDLSKKSVYNAQGTVVETKKDATNAMVFSNGTGIFFDPDTRLEVRKFVQEPFTPNRTDMEVEPSISQTQSYLVRGVVALCTSKLVAGSSMVYRTPQAVISIRGRKVVMEVSDQGTKISLLEGDVTVRGGEYDVGGQVIRPGQQAIITPGASVGAPGSIQVQDIPSNERPELERKAAMACMAKNTVYFETAERKEENRSAFDGDPTDDIRAVPVVPVDLPPQITVSPARAQTG